MPGQFFLYVDIDSAAACDDSGLFELGRRDGMGTQNQEKAGSRPTLDSGRIFLLYNHSYKTLGNIFDVINLLVD
ncbi:hypothetical protein JTE90_014117 [Oedothorax gibbosus]|uniref:Uncharacterized protein n=1 Tax=Oedothorax gibbosus TaxID=931172 RepID=A0AAV6V7L2_9ARAC|nr:hypothetical protein JTE90_014117 [Oedothorax gibbosus]